MLMVDVPAGISMLTRLAVLLVLVTTSPQSYARAQTASHRGESRQTFEAEVSVGYVLIPVVVRSRTGFVNRLSERQFELRVDGEPVAIESFEKGNEAPIGVLFLQDLSGSMGIGSKIARSRSLVDCILGRRRPGDEFALASFSDQRLFVEIPFPGSPEALLEVAASWTGYGRTALHDAVAWLPEIVHARTSPRRAVVLITDGVDNASALGAGEARDEIKHAEVPVHVVGLETGPIETLHPEGGKVHRLADALNLIGWATGGGYHPITDESDIIPACNAIVADLRHQYVLGFSTRAESRPERHRIEVEVTGKSKEIRIDHRRSYDGALPRNMNPSP